MWLWGAALGAAVERCGPPPSPFLTLWFLAASSPLLHSFAVLSLLCSWLTSLFSYECQVFCLRDRANNNTASFSSSTQFPTWSLKSLEACYPWEQSPPLDLCFFLGKLWAIVSFVLFYLCSNVIFWIVVPEKYIWVFALGNCECDFILK